MISHRPRIAVIGAGIIGSAITYNLAVRGADVMLLDKEPKPGSGVTGDAFGWVNIINGTPGDASYALWREGIAEYLRLNEIMPAALSHARRGSLFWKATPQETERFFDVHQRAGENVELLDRAALESLEPRLRRVPDCAVFSRDDLALNPSGLAETLVNAAVGAGATTRFGSAITAIETVNGRVRGVRIADDTVAADIVVMAAGGGIKALASMLGIETGIATSPALLLRYACSMPVIHHILRGPRLEVRQTDDDTLLVAKSYVEDGTEDGPYRIGENILTVMKEELDLPGDVMLKSANVGQRPVFADGLPRMGFLPEVAGLYIAAGHPGVILAPLIGRRAAEEVLKS